MRNIQKNLVKKWSRDKRITDIIKQLPDFCDYYEYQVFSSLLPNIGEYYINAFKYDINDFMRNPNNKLFKVLLSFKSYYNKNEEKDIFLADFLLLPQ